MSEWLLNNKEDSIDRKNFTCNRLYLRDPKKVPSQRKYGCPVCTDPSDLLSNPKINCSYLKRVVAYRCFKCNKPFDKVTKRKEHMKTCTSYRFAKLISKK